MSNLDDEGIRPNDHDGQGDTGSEEWAGGRVRGDRQAIMGGARKRTEKENYPLQVSPSL